MFSKILARTAIRDLARFSQRAGDPDVTRALSRPAGGLDLADFAALLGPAAARRLDEAAAAASRVRERRFGRVVHLYAPVYLSNECMTTCTYCGFARGLPIARRTLSVAEARREASVLSAHGFRHLLLLTGEHQHVTGVDFLAQHIRALRRVVPQVSIEVQVWSEEEYRRLAAAGCSGVVVYQETYDPASYARFHIAGKKRRYEWRLEAPERAARAGMRRLGIGALLGLHEPWREDAIAVAAHAQHLTRLCWRQEVTVSVPRIRPSASGYSPERPVSDRDLVQYVCALRLALPDVGIVASTREPAWLRDNLLRVGVTHTSAGSHTEPGGYSDPGAAEPQFEIADTRSPAEVASAIRALGYEPVWKDWDSAMAAVPVSVAGGRA